MSYSGGVGQGPGHEAARHHDARLPDRRLCAGESRRTLMSDAHARVYEQNLLEKWAGVSSDFGWLWFGVGRPHEFPGQLRPVLCSWPAGTSRPRSCSTSPPTAATRTPTTSANARAIAGVSIDELHGPVYKTTYVRREYAVSSDQGGVLQPIQQHSWDVTWHVPDPRGSPEHPVLTLHPYSSMRELQTYFVFNSDNAVEWPTW